MANSLPFNAIMVEEMENWINQYPRRIHGYHSAGELFEEELKKIS